MKNYQGKSRWATIVQSKPVLILLACFLIFFVVSLVSFVGKMEDTAKNKKMAAEKIAVLEKQKEKLSTDIDRLQTDKGVEDSIREKFGLAKEGEGMIVVVDDKAPVPETQQANTSKFWTFVRNWFK